MTVALLAGALGLILGLWWGERGRRMDAQLRATGQEPLPKGAKPKSSRVPLEAQLSPEELAEKKALEESAHKAIMDETMALGHSRKAAKEEADHMLNELRRLGMV